MYVNVSTVADWQYWTISRPERRNALGTEILTELEAAFRLAHLDLQNPDSPVRGIVLTAQTVASRSGNIWVAGGDLRELASLSDQEAQDYAQRYAKLCQGLQALPVPVITALAGDAIGGGAELALCGDIRLGAEDARLCFKQLKVGLPTGYGGSSRLRDLVGLATAQRMIYFCETLAAPELLRLGLLHRVAAGPAGLEGLIAETITHLASVNKGTLAAQKALLTAGIPGSRQSELFAATWRNSQHAAFLKPWEVG